MFSLDNAYAGIPKSAMEFHRSSLSHRFDGKEKISLVENEKKRDRFERKANYASRNAWYIILLSCHNNNTHTHIRTKTKFKTKVLDFAKIPFNNCCMKKF